MSLDESILLAAVTINELGELALDHALDLAHRDPTIEVVHFAYAIEPAVDPITGSTTTERPADATKRLADFGRAAVERAIGRHGELHTTLVSGHVLIGPASSAITAFAAELDADLIVIATHGRRGVRRLFLGSVAEEVVRTAGCPVVVVRRKSHQLVERAPEIEPSCPDCVTRRHEAQTPTACCDHHSEHHPRPHVYAYEPRSNDAARPWGFHI